MIRRRLLKPQRNMMRDVVRSVQEATREGARALTAEEAASHRYERMQRRLSMIPPRAPEATAPAGELEYGRNPYAPKL
jgi:hypothetical protein